MSFMTQLSRSLAGPDHQSVTSPSADAPHGRWWALAVVCIGTMMAFVNVSSTVGALATIQADLHATATAAVWITSAYSLVVASLVLCAGTLGDLIGRRRVFITGAATFAAGSALACLSAGTGLLITAQAVMGVGGAMLLPTGLAIVSHTFADPRQRTEAISIWAGSSGLGLAVGPLGAGLLLAHFSWHSVYLINVVLGAFALVGALALVGESKHPTRTLDPIGVILGTLTVAAVTFAVIEGGHRGYTDGLIVGAYLVFAGALALFVIHEWRHHDPMLDVRLFRSASFSAVQVTAAIAFLGFTGTALVMVLYLQHVQGLTALGASIRLLTMFGPFIVVSAIAGKLVQRTGFKVMLTAGLVVMGTGVLALTASPAGTGFSAIWPGLLLAGIGAGLLVAPTTAAAVISVPPAEAGMASAAVNMFRQVGNVLGASILGTIVTSAFASNLVDDLTAAHLPGPVVDAVSTGAERGETSADALPSGIVGLVHDAVQQAFTDASHTALTVGAIILLVTALPVAVFVRQRPVSPTAA
ncbi:MFS transporter [Gordonia sp. NPDC003376]